MVKKERNVMDMSRLDMFIEANQKFLPAEKIVFIKERLMDIDESQFVRVASLMASAEMKNPTTVLLVSILFGTFGVDRFLIGDTGFGILKLLTGGMCGIFTIVDWFVVPKKVKEANFNKLMTIL